MKTITNRYNNKFTFTLQDDGNIKWDGNFEYCRFGFPNDYTKAYDKYVTDGGNLSLDEFKEQVHHTEYLEEGGYISSDINLDYAKLVESRGDIIDMVDPSGGPYMKGGDVFMGKIIKQFKPREDGYLIITE